MKTTNILFTLITWTGMMAYSQNWGPVGNNVLNNQVRSFFVNNNQLYAGGLFSVPGFCVGIWDGSNWSGISSGFSSPPVSFCIYNSELYAGGHFVQASGQLALHIARFDGTSWKPVGIGISGIGAVLCLKSYKGKLYAGFSATNSLKYIATWDGSVWETVGGGANSSVVSMEIYNDVLYVAGFFDTIGNVPAAHIAKWDGSVWTAVSNITSGKIEVLRTDPVNNILYAGGEFNMIGAISAERVAKWDGNSWAALGGGISDSGAKVLTLDIGPTGELYAGGKFSKAGNATVLNIAKWNGSDWSEIDQGMNDVVYAVSVYKGELYAGGSFTSAGSSSVNFIAKIAINGTGIFESGNYKFLTIYPNPIQNGEFLNFEREVYKDNCTLYIYDCLGVEVKRSELGADHKIKIELPPGLYFYKFKGYSGKFLVK